MNLDEAKQRLKKAKDLPPQKFYEEVYEVAGKMLHTQEFFLATTILASFVRQAELEQIEFSRKGVYKEFLKMVELQAGYDEENKRR